LKKIEQDVSSQNKGSRTSEDTIWQVQISQTAKKEDFRGTDTLELEHRNSESTDKLLNNKNAIEFVTNKLSAVPEIAETHESYPLNILRADLLKYMLLWSHGGFNVDMDVFPARSIKTCRAFQPFFTLLTKSLQHTHPNESLVAPYASPQFMHSWPWTRSYGLIQFTMYAPIRFSPLLRETIVHVLAHTRRHNKSHGRLFRSWSYDEKTVLGVTGADVFTDVILGILSSSLPWTHPLMPILVIRSPQSLGRSKDGYLGLRFADFAILFVSRPRRLPREILWEGSACCLLSVWTNGQRHSKASGFNDFDASANHRFGRTWKKEWYGYIVV
ncbi:uncharacterized protein N7529_009760, partial [Penicillium soppii]|uniref:uncharacterized protein n=1 Tax=Penicillium soppii TaxID=69789 RepID=UPI0025477986